MMVGTKKHDVSLTRPDGCPPSGRASCSALPWLEAAVKRFETELGESRKAGLSLEARLSDKQKTLDRLEAEAVPLRERVTKFNRNAHEMAGHIEKEKSRSAGVEEDASLLRDAVVRLDLERCDLETNFEGEKAKASRLNTELQACQQELRKAQEDKSWLERAKERLEREQQDNQALRQEAERQARQLRMQLKDAKTKLVMLGGVSESAIFGEGALSTMRPISPGGHSVVSMTSVGEMQKVLSHGVSMPQLSSKGSGIHGSSRVSFRKGG
jgi:predicted  nucleic acid-binding Zn-ribbon protein